MISIQSSMNELDKVHQSHEVVVECYLGAIKNCATYAVEFEDQSAADYRKHLTTLAEEVAAGDQNVLLESRSTFRSLLRDYRDRAAKYLMNIRNELSGTARALEEILDSLSQSDGDHEMRLHATVEQLRAAAASPEGKAVRAVLAGAATTIEQSVEHMRKQHQLTISQFQIEIRMLHKRIDNLEAAVSIDSLTQLYSRVEMENRVRAAKAGSYLLMLITARGIRRAASEFGGLIADELVGAFTRRLRNSLPPQAVIARWGHEEIVVISDMTKADVLASGKWITEHLSGSYACLSGGKTVRPALQLNVGVVDTSDGENADAVLERIGIFLTDS